MNVKFSNPISIFHWLQTGDESNPSAAVEDVMETPEKLRDLDLDAFADELQRQVMYGRNIVFALIILFQTSKLMSL